MSIRQPRINNQIRISPVRLINEKGQNFGIVPIEKALQIAHEAGLDLIEVAAETRPPVCRIADYGKYQYQQEKKFRKQKSKKIEVKGIRISLQTARHDLELKAKQAEKFLKRGDKVKIEMILRGREKAHFDLAKEQLKEFLQSISQPIIIEQEPKKQPRGLVMIITKNKT